MKISTAYRGLAGLAVAMVPIFSSCDKKSGTVSPPKNKIAFIYKTDNTDAQAYRALLDANGCDVMMVDVATVILRQYFLNQVLL